MSHTWIHKKMISQSATDITTDQLKQMNLMLSFPTDLNQGRGIYRWMRQDKSRGPRWSSIYAYNFFCDINVYLCDWRCHK